MAVVPTKGNLIARKRSLALAEMGYDLMDKKRNVLIREMMRLIDDAADIQSQIDHTFSTAYRSLQAANISLGIIDRIAGGMPIDRTVEVRNHSIMGVEIPSIPPDNSAPRLAYGLRDTNSALDDAYIKFHQVKQLTRRLAEVETTIYRLANAIKKTQKRANALKNIVIPQFTASIKFITDVLEEREREEFARLKVIKRNAQAARSQI